MSIAHITLVTRDLAPFQDFFREALGWQPINRPGNIAVSAAWLAIAPGQELHLLEIKDYQPSNKEKEYGRHIAITWPVAEYESLKNRLSKLGAEIIPAERPTPFPRFFFRAPDDYIFEVVPE